MLRTRIADAIGVLFILALVLVTYICAFKSGEAAGRDQAIREGLTQYPITAVTGEPTDPE